jgi:hypothetical protein
MSNKEEDEVSDGSVTDFSESESEPDIGYIKTNKKPSRYATPPPTDFLGIPQRFLLILYILIASLAVMSLCIYGDAQQIDTSQVSPKDYETPKFFHYVQGC